MYQHPVLQQGLVLSCLQLLAIEWLCAQTTNNLLLGILVSVLLRKSLLGRQREGSYRFQTDELRDKILFTQPESSHLGDCPICCLPLPLGKGKVMAFTIMGCCSKIICKGCAVANDVCQERKNIEPSCPFCRHPVPSTQEKCVKYLMARAEQNDPAALYQIGTSHYLRQDYESALPYWTKAAELGNTAARYNLSIMYRNGQGVEKDEKKEWYHLEDAAIQGHPTARHNLGVYENCSGMKERAVKNWIISANLGFDNSIQALKSYYKRRLISKEDFAAALRAHKAAVDATKSPQRETAERNWSREMVSTM